MAHLTRLLGGEDGLLAELDTRALSRGDTTRLWTSVLAYAFDRLSPDSAILQMKAMPGIPPDIGRAIARLADAVANPAKVRGFRGALLADFTEEARNDLAAAGPNIRAVSLLNGRCEVAGVSDYGDTMSLLSTSDLWPTVAASLPIVTLGISTTEIDLANC